MKKLKKIIVLSIFNLGDLISKINFILDFSFLYVVCNYLLLKSSDLQDKWKLDGPWKDVIKSDDI